MEIEVISFYSYPYIGYIVQRIENEIHATASTHPIYFC